MPDGSKITVEMDDVVIIDMDVLRKLLATMWHTQNTKLEDQGVFCTSGGKISIRATIPPEAIEQVQILEDREQKKYVVVYSRAARKWTLLG